MNNLKKIGLTALAGSLVATSVFAGEMSVSGSASVTAEGYTGENLLGGTAFSMGNQLDFAGSGELDNGMTVSVAMTIDQNDDSDDTSLLSLGGTGGPLQSPPTLQYTRYDILCWMQGIVEQIGEDRWNQWSLYWSTTHECSWQRTPGANRRIHPIMMANGVPMRWDTYGHRLRGIKDSGAYETKWGSVSGMHWRTSWGNGDANAPYVDFLNGASHYDGSYLRPSQYKVPDDTLCVVEGMMRVR